MKELTSDPDLLHRREIAKSARTDFIENWFSERDSHSRALRVENRALLIHPSRKLVVVNLVGVRHAKFEGNCSCRLGADSVDPFAPTGASSSSEKKRYETDLDLLVLYFHEFYYLLVQTTTPEFFCGGWLHQVGLSDCSLYMISKWLTIELARSPTNTSFEAIMGKSMVFRC